MDPLSQEIPHGWQLFTTLVPWAVAAVSTLIAWAFASGKFSGLTAHKLGELEASLQKKAGADRVVALEKRVQGEHDERKRLVEQINLTLGKIQVDRAGDAGRLTAVEQDVTELRRRVFNGSGMAGS